MATYQTNQKKALIAFLSAHSDRAFTIEEIVAEMTAESCFAASPGKSTIYRLLPPLVESGAVRRFSQRAGRKAAYQIVGGEACHCHMHMKCLHCGRLFHMSDRESAFLQQQVQEDTGFTLDLTETLFYGSCANCSRRLAQKTPSAPEDNR